MDVKGGLAPAFYRASPHIYNSAMPCMTMGARPVPAGSSSGAVSYPQLGPGGLRQQAYPLTFGGRFPDCFRRGPRRSWSRLLSSSRYRPRQLGVGEVLADALAEQANETLAIAGLSIVEAVGGFIEISEDVEGLNGDVGAVDGPLD